MSGLGFGAWLDERAKRRREEAAAELERSDGLDLVPAPGPPPSLYSVLAVSEAILPPAALRPFLEECRAPRTGEVEPMTGDGDSGIHLTVGEGWALYEWLESKEGPRYWEDPRLSGLQSKLSAWIRTDAPW